MVVVLETGGARKPFRKKRSGIWLINSNAAMLPDDSLHIFTKGEISMLLHSEQQQQRLCHSVECSFRI